MVKDIPSDDSPAKAAGIEPGDIIIAVDGKPVEYVGQLQQVIGFRKPGDVVKVEVARKGGVRKTFDVKLQPLNDTPQVAAADENGDSDNANAPSGAAMSRLGISVEPVTPDVAQQLQLPADARGLIVTDVTPGGPGLGGPVRRSAAWRPGHHPVGRRQAGEAPRPTCGRRSRRRRPAASSPCGSTIRGPRAAGWSGSGWPT